MAAHECYMAMLEMDDHQQALTIEEQWVTVEPTEDLEEISLDDNFPGQVTYIGTQSPVLVLDLLLRNNQDVFAWSHEDMLGINPSIMVHKLNVSRSHLPV